MNDIVSHNQLFRNIGLLVFRFRMKRRTYRFFDHAPFSSFVDFFSYSARDLDTRVTFRRRIVFSRLATFSDFFRLQISLSAEKNPKILMKKPRENCPRNGNVIISNTENVFIFGAQNTSVDAYNIDRQL